MAVYLHGSGQSAAVFLNYLGMAGAWSAIDRISGSQQPENWDLQSASTTGMIVHGM